MTITYTPEDGALDVQPAELPYTPLTLPQELQDRFNRLTSREINDRAVLALRRDIATAMSIPWISVDIGETQVTRHDIQRGERIRLPLEWIVRIQGMNGQVPPVTDADWEQVRNQIADFIGLPVPHVERQRNTDGSWYFQRSWVPNDGEIADGRALVVPEEQRGQLAGIRSEGEFEAGRDVFIDNIAAAHHLPAGRIHIEINQRGGIRCVYREPVPGAPLRLPRALADAITQANAEPEPQRQAALREWQAVVARYFGLEPNQIMMMPSPDGGPIAFQRAPPGGPPGSPRQNHLGADPPNPPKRLGQNPPPPVPPIVPPGGGGPPPKGPNPPSLPPPTDDSLSTGAIVGIVSGSIIGLILIIFVIFFIRKRRDQSKRSITAPARSSA
jgi:hypothetical protein